MIVDEQRAPLVKLAFTLYSTGEWPLHRLAAHLEEQGLRSLGTRRYPERPLGNRINAMLRNPYYIGIVAWNGQRYPGKHDRLIDEDLRQGARASDRRQPKRRTPTEASPLSTRDRRLR